MESKRKNPIELLKERIVEERCKFCNISDKEEAS